MLPECFDFFKNILFIKSGASKIRNSTENLQV